MSTFCNYISMKLNESAIQLISIRAAIIRNLSYDKLHVHVKHLKKFHSPIRFYMLIYIKSTFLQQNKILTNTAHIDLMNRPIHR